MEQKEYFKRINFNKPWKEKDWERYFQAHEAYRLAVRNSEIRKKPMAKIKFEDSDAVMAFEPILREYGVETTPNVVKELKSVPFIGDTHPDLEYTPATSEDPHFWGEGAPLASLPIYRDCCRWAIYVSKELGRYLKRRRKGNQAKNFKSEFTNLQFHANWLAIDVAQGHQIGYAKDRILGNIAKCRRAVKHADSCIRSLNRISRQTKSTRFKEDLFSFAVQLRGVLFMWIDELQSRASR